MRTWWIHPAYLCRQRLLGQHREIHMLASAWQKNLMQHHPLTKFWKAFGNWNGIVYYHDIIVHEMKIRGLVGHKTDLTFDATLNGSLSVRTSDYCTIIPQITLPMITQDAVDLLERWERYGQHGKPRCEIARDNFYKLESIYDDPER